MTEEVRPVGPIAERDRRQAQRREGERRSSAADRASALSAQGPAEDPATPADPSPPVDPASSFAAQVLGQGGQRKGLKGGPPVLDAARSGYLGREYSGAHDRRPPSGLLKKTDV